MSLTAAGCVLPVGATAHHHPRRRDRNEATAAQTHAPPGPPLLRSASPHTCCAAPPSLVGREKTAGGAWALVSQLARGWKTARTSVTALPAPSAPPHLRAAGKRCCGCWRGQRAHAGMAGTAAEGAALAVQVGMQALAEEMSILLSTHLTADSLAAAAAAAAAQDTFSGGYGCSGGCGPTLRYVRASGSGSVRVSGAHSGIATARLSKPGRRCDRLPRDGCFDSRSCVLNWTLHWLRSGRAMRCGSHSSAAAGARVGRCAHHPWPGQCYQSRVRLLHQCQQR